MRRRKNAQELEALARQICIALAIGVPDLVGTSRVGCLPDARAIFAYRAIEQGWRNCDVARFLRRNHSTVIKSIARYETYALQDALFQERLGLLERFLETQNSTIL